METFHFPDFREHVLVGLNDEEPPLDAINKQSCFKNEWLKILVEETQPDADQIK